VTPRRRRVLRLGTALGAMLMLIVALPAQATVTRVVGTASGPFETDTIYVTLAVRGEGPAARGVFRILHQTPTGVFAHLAGDVDCLSEVIPGILLVVTGTIRGGFDGLGIDPVGHRVSVVYGRGLRASLSLDVSFASGHTIPPCGGDPILAVPVEHGGFRII
jgi:hypothetical protein